MISSPIAVFDSGLGGLSVLRSLIEVLPHENFIYLADNKRVPYGGLSPETIIQYTAEAISFLEKEQAKVVVLGCHTASARYVSTNKVPVMGMIQGFLNQMEEILSFKKVAILGTVSTIESRVYEQLILSRNPGVQVISIPCPALVPKIESGCFSDTETLSFIEEYVRPLKEMNVDAAFLACTHYPLISNLFQKVLGDEVVLIDPSYAIALDVKNYLAANNLLNHEREPKRLFYVTGAVESFAKQGSYFLTHLTDPVKEFPSAGIQVKKVCLL